MSLLADHATPCTCACGCGTPIPERGRRGRPQRYARNHNSTKRRPVGDRFWEKVDRSRDGECWRWLGTKVPKGHGQFYRAGRQDYAHRVAYELVVGPIPEGFEIDHLCRNPWCVNPAHLEAVTPMENWRRGDSPTALNSRKTHCARGHAYDEANTYWWRGERHCRRCQRERREVA